MTAIRVWNGSAWGAPKYCTSSGYFGDTFKEYKETIPGVPAGPSTPGPLLGNYDFTTDSLGWRYYTGAAYDGVPGCNGSEMILGKTAPTTTPWCKSPTMTGLQGNNCYAQCSIRCEVGGTSSSDIGIQMLWKVNAVGDSIAFHKFRSSFGNIIMQSPSYYYIGSADDPYINIQSWCATADQHIPWTLYIDWVRAIDTNGNLIYGPDIPGSPAVPEVPGYYPKYWNGSAWVAQNQA